MFGNEPNNAALAVEALQIVEQCRPLLAGHHPAVQGAALADLLATWIAGHPSEVREEAIAMHIEGMRALIPINEPRAR